MENETGKITLDRLDERTRMHGEFIEEMRLNHLPHIYNRLSGIEKKLAYYTGGLAVVLSLVQWLISYLK